jgi:hypothetical protein
MKNREEIIDWLAASMYHQEMSGGTPQLRELFFASWILGEHQNDVETAVNKRVRYYWKNNNKKGTK